MKRPDDLNQTGFNLDIMNDQPDYSSNRDSNITRDSLIDRDVRDKQVKIFVEQYPELKTPDGLRALERHSRQMKEIIGQDAIVTPPDLPLPRSRPQKKVKR